MSAADAATVTDADRLQKLWEAYRVQEEEYHAAIAHVDRLTREIEGRGATFAERERVIAEKDAQIARLAQQLEDRDARIRSLEALEQDVKAVETYKARIAELEQALAQEKERLAKLFLLYEEATKQG